jgi:hypothetical protein
VEEDATKVVSINSFPRSGVADPPPLPLAGTTKWSGQGVRASCSQTLIRGLSMGASITAYLQIDDNTPPDEPPFTNDPSTWDLSMDIGLATGKDYEFFAAICGVRNTSDIHPLFPCRGLPPSRFQDLREINGDEPNVSWLTLSEIGQSFEHMQIEVSSLSRPVQMLLQTMQIAENLYGPDRVRFIFQVSD